MLALARATHGPKERQCCRSTGLECRHSRREPTALGRKEGLGESAHGRKRWDEGGVRAALEQIKSERQAPTGTMCRKRTTLAGRERRQRPSNESASADAKAATRTCEPAGEAPGARQPMVKMREGVDDGMYERGTRRQLARFAGADGGWGPVQRRSGGLGALGDGTRRRAAGLSLGSILTLS
jgi:hypothetical protein